jgi:uncharacterized protein (TIGR03000 family)
LHERGSLEPIVAWKEKVVMRMLFHAAASLGLLGLLGNLPLQAAQGDDAPVVINTIVPAGATVSFDGVQTKQTGTLRRFVSPPLEPGHTYTYRIRVVGQDFDDTRRLSVRAGEHITLDFSGGEVRESRGQAAQAALPGYTETRRAMYWSPSYGWYGPPRTFANQSPYGGYSWSPWGDPTWNRLAVNPYAR